MAIEAIYGGVLAGLQSYLGAHWILFALYLVTNILDTFTAAISSHKKTTFSFDKLISGMFKKLGYWALIVIAFVVAIAVESIGSVLNLDLSFARLIGWATLSVLLMHEVRSVLTNLTRLGIAVPPILTKTLNLAERKIEEAEGDYQGTMVVNTTDPNKDTFRFELTCNPADLADMKELRFKVRNEDKSSQ